MDQSALFLSRILALTGILRTAAIVSGSAAIASFSSASSVPAVSAASSAAAFFKALLFEEIFAVFIFLEIYDHLAVRFFSFTVSRDIFLILKRGVNDPPLIRIHGLKSYGLSRSLYLKRDILGKILECFLSSLSVVLCVSLDVNITVHIFVDNEGQKILKGIEGLSSLADQDTHVLPFHINCEDTCILLIIFSDHNIHLHCFEDICQKIVRDFLDLCDLFISELRDHHFLFGGSFLTLISFLDRMFFSAMMGNRYASFRHKPVASIVVARRAGTSASFDVLNKYAGISQMITVGSTYWNEFHALTKDDVPGDPEGLQTLRNLARNMVYVMKCLKAGRDAGINAPANETEVLTNFVR